MKYFTIKDFILYNGPCFNCGNKVVLSAHQLDGATSRYGKMDKIPLHLSNDTVSISLPSIEIQINILNNSYKTKWFGKDILKYDPSYFSIYLENKFLYFVSTCHHCFTEITSSHLFFDGKNVKPISILSEKLSLNTKDALYIIQSDVSLNYGLLRIFDEKGRKEKDNIPIPPLLLGKLKTKANALKKIQTYILYS